jgi:hypothetical protein
MKKLLILLLFFFQLTLSFGQSIGTEVEGEVIYKSGGLYIYYSIIYMGSGDCGTKYKVTIFIENKSEDRINVAGSLIDVDNGFNPWENNYNQCSFSGRLLFGYYPNYESWKILEPNFSDKNSHTVYMKPKDNSLPKVSWNILPRYVNN